MDTPAVFQEQVVLGKGLDLSSSLVLPDPAIGFFVMVVENDTVQDLNLSNGVRELVEDQQCGL